jgi:flavodoxin
VTFQKGKEMKIGVIVYSKTGHTFAVASDLKQALVDAGHTVTLERLETVGQVKPGRTNLTLESRPGTGGYDALVFGAPAWGGQMASPMAAYLEPLASLEGQRVACLVTGLFPAGWGRNQAIAQMKEVCASKGATVVGAGSVGWLSLRRKREIASVVGHLSEALDQALTRA